MLQFSKKRFGCFEKPHTVTGSEAVFCKRLPQYANFIMLLLEKYEIMKGVIFDLITRKHLIQADFSLAEKQKNRFQRSNAGSAFSDTLLNAVEIRSANPEAACTLTAISLENDIQRVVENVCCDGHHSHPNAFVILNHILSPNDTIDHFAFLSCEFAVHVCEMFFGRPMCYALEN